MSKRYDSDKWTPTATNYLSNRKKMSDKLFKMLSTNKETQTEDPHVSTAGIIL